MKILHVVFTWWPEPCGGTEVYVRALSRQLHAQGIDAVIAAPGAVDSDSMVEGLRVRRFACDPGAQTLDALYGAGDTVASDAFERILSSERPDVVHQHAISPACSVDLVRRARRHGIPVVFTYHSPAVSCQRGTLLHGGDAVCAGELRTEICTPCVLSGLGLGTASSWVVARTPALLGRAAGRLHLQGGAWTALRMTALMDKRLDEVRDLFRLASRIVSLSPWTTRLLELNGVGADRIVSSPHGIVAGRGSGTRRLEGRVVRLVHLGRFDPTKGTGLLLRAMQLVPALPIALDIYGVPQTGLHSGVEEELRRLAADDDRVTFRAPVAHDDVVSTLAGYDAVVVPSQWLETGPLVVLEAFAAGVPVIGSHLGGIADKIRDDVDGLLVAPFDSIESWAAALRRAADAALMPRLRRGVVAPRQMADVTRDMVATYRSVVPSVPVLTT